MWITSALAPGYLGYRVRFHDHGPNDAKMKERVFEWLQASAAWLLPTLQVLFILAVAWLLHHLAMRLIERLSQRRELPPHLAIAARRIVGFVVMMTTLVSVLDVFGVSGRVLWTAFTGFAAVGAVAFFAAWSVLSNIFCSLLIFLTRPFRLHDTVELLENGEKPGLKGRVVDVNLLYTTLMETGDARSGTVVQIPNSLFFQRTLRRWRGEAIPELPARLPGKDDTAA